MIEAKYTVGDFIPAKLPRDNKGCTTFDMDLNMVMCPATVIPMLVLRSEVTKNGYSRHTVAIHGTIKCCIKDEGNNPKVCVHIEERLEPERPWVK